MLLNALIERNEEDLKWKGSVFIFPPIVESFNFFLSNIMGKGTRESFFFPPPNSEGRIEKKDLHKCFQT